MPESLLGISHCEVCGNQSLRSVLDLGSHPMCDDLVPIDDTRQCVEYPIEIMFCDRCLTAHQRFQIPKHTLFPQTYHYRSRHTADVLDGMAQLVTAVEAEVGDLNGRKVLDIGCNDGSLLSFFRKKGASTYGIEPTRAAQDASKTGHTVIEDFFDESIASKFVAKYGQPDIVTFTNVFAHIEDLSGIIKALKIISSDKTTIVIENHYLGSIIAKNQFDTFYHEHPRTYSFSSFLHIAKALGKNIAKLEFPQRYGGNIQVFMRSGAELPQTAELLALEKKEARFGEDLLTLASRIEDWRKAKHEEIAKEVKAGRLEAKAFPGRAAIPVKLLGLDADSIVAVYEKPGSGKIGHYVPGTRIPIRSDNEFPQDKSAPPVILNLAWHIGDEIQSYMRARGYQGRIIDIISQSDFDDNR